MISDADLITHTGAETAQLVWLRGLEKAAIAAINKRTGRYYGATATITENLSWRGGPLYLANTPTALATFTSWDGTAWVTVDATTYYLQGNAVRWNTATAWSSLAMPQTYQVTYQAGYTPTGDVWAAPDDIRQAVLLLVGNWFENRESVVVGDSATPELPNSVTWLLESHMRIAV